MASPKITKEEFIGFNRIHVDGTKRIFKVVCWEGSSSCLNVTLVQIETTVQFYDRGRQHWKLLRNHK